VDRRVLIVGGGVVGLCTAYECARRGLRVTVLERGGPEDASCSLGNAGMIVPSHVVPMAAPGMMAAGLRYLLDAESPFYVRPRPSLDLLLWGFRFWRAARASRVARAAPVLRDLHLQSRSLFEELSGALGGIGLVERGLLSLFRTQHGFRDEMRAAAFARSLGLPAELLTPEEVQALEPDLRLDVAGAVRWPLDAHLVPARLMAGLRRTLDDLSVRVVYGAEVRGFRVDGRAVASVDTTAGPFDADEVVLAAGVWSTAVARDLGLALPMQAGKGYSLTLEDAPHLPRHCALLSEARVAVTPMGGALRVGGTLELCGIDARIDPARVRGILKALPQYLPDLAAADFERLPVWCGLRPCPPDGLPYLGRTRRLANVAVACGHSMMGVSLGPVTGRLIAEILSGEPPSIDVTILDPDRYAR
jgi:D-amino-acid dehydrogenase